MASISRQIKRLPRETPLIQSLDRGLLLLEAVAKASEPMPLSKMAELLEIDRSSAFRLANTLKRRGFLAFEYGRKDYILGPSIPRISRNYAWGRTLAGVARQDLRRLASVTKETAHLAIREGSRVLFIDHVSVNHLITVTGQAGELVPLHCTAHGKALLADFTRDDLEDLLGNKPLRRYTPQTMVSIGDLATVCTKIQAQGFATDCEEHTPGMRCLAAPIRNGDGIVVASIGISAPVARFPDDRHLVVGRHVCDAAKKVSQSLLLAEVEYFPIESHQM